MSMFHVGVVRFQQWEDEPGRLAELIFADSPKMMANGGELCRSIVVGVEAGAM